MSDHGPPLTGAFSHERSLHELTTKLTVIMGTTQVLERKIRLGRDMSPEQMLTMLARIRQHAESAHNLVFSLHYLHGERTQSSPE
jgi:signal transduction histidine kinase